MSRPRRNDPKQWIVTASQVLQARLDLLQSHRTAQTLDSGPQFTRSLRSAQHQHTKQCCFARVQIVDVEQAVPVLRYTGACGMNQHRQLLCAQIVKPALDRSLVVANNRIPVRGLIARSGEANKGERVVFWRCPFFFEETT